MSAVLETLHRQARERKCSVILPETCDSRVLEAGRKFAEQQLGTAVLLDPPEEFTVGDSIEVVRRETILEECAEALFVARKHRGMTREQARIELANPLLVAALLVRLGRVDAAVAGSASPTAEVLRAGIRGIGTAEGCSLVSSFFLMDFQDRAITFADCAVVPYPDAAQLAQIAIDAADNHQRLTGEVPLVAMLSFSTLGSAEHASPQTVREATAIVRQRRADLCVDGELQFDAAFVPAVAKRKAPESSVSGDANVLVFPNLDAGNIAYKITERLGGAQAIGPIVQGLAKPMMDLSRGCSVEDIIDVAVIAANLV